MHKNLRLNIQEALNYVQKKIPREQTLLLLNQELASLPGKIYHPGHSDV